MATATATSLGRIESLLGDEARSLLEHRCETVTREMLHLPGPDFVDRMLTPSDRTVRVLRSLQALSGGTGLISGRKAFQRPMADGIDLLNAIQDVYLLDEVCVA
jgi:fructose-bisphosphate aldolase, class I